MDAPGYVDFFEIGVDTIVSTPGSEVSEGAVRREGSDANLIVSGASEMAEEVIRQVAIVAAGLTLDTAEGEALDRLVHDLPFPVERNPAAPALVPVAFTRPNATKGAGTIPTGFRVAFDGVSFEALTDTSVGTGVLTVTATMRALVSGPGGNIESGTQGSLTGSLWDTSFVPSAAEDGAGGDDAESDANLRARARKAHETARRATLAAIEFGALTVPQVSFAAAYEVTQPDGVTLAYVIDLIVSDANGKSNAPMLAAVAIALEEYRPCGIPVTLLGGTRILTAIQVRLTFLAGVDTVAAWAQAQARIVAAVNALAPQQALVLSLITAAALSGGTDVTGILDCDVLVPAGPVVPAQGSTNTIRTSTALVTHEVV